MLYVLAAVLFLKVILFPLCRDSDTMKLTNFYWLR